MIRFIILLSVAAACGTTDVETELSGASQELINANLATEDGAVVALTSGGHAYCTATLVSPRVLLTAAHCVEATSNAGSAFFGNDVEGVGSRISVTRKIKHVDWTGTLGTGDIGMMLLAAPMDADLPVPMFADTPVVGTPVRRVGFGIYDQQGNQDGKKREGMTELSSIDGDVFITAGAGVSTCSGDSGGPALIDIGGVEHVAAAHSFGAQENGVCIEGSDGSTRVDLYVEDFIQPWIETYDLSCGKDWYCYPTGCSADPDCAPCGADGTCSSGCALPDPDCATAELGEICQRDSQCKTGLCVAWSAVPTSKFCSQPCSSGCPDDMECKSILGTGDVCYYKDAPAGVAGDECVEHTDCGTYQCSGGMCIQECDLVRGLFCGSGYTCEDDGTGRSICIPPEPESSGGCTSRTPGSAILLLAVLALAWRRPRRTI